MTNETSSSATTTLSSLLNILGRLSDWLSSRNETWQRNKEFAYVQWKVYREGKWDREDADLWHGRITYNEALEVVETLVSDLIRALEGNPFPEEQKRVAPLANELFPEARVRFDLTKKPLSGVRLWHKIFALDDCDVRIDLEMRVCFPAMSDEWDVEEIERRLLQLVREDGSIVAADVPVALGVNPNGKSYRAVKKTLLQRGWVWRGRKCGGKMEKIVLPPKVTAP